MDFNVQALRAWQTFRLVLLVTRFQALRACELVLVGKDYPAWLSCKSANPENPDTYKRMPIVISSSLYRPRL